MKRAVPRHMDLERERGITIKARVGLAQVPRQDGQTTSSTSSTRPGTSTSTTRSRARSPPARARSSSSTRRRASRRRPSPTPTSRSTTTSRSSRSQQDRPARPPTPRAPRGDRGGPRPRLRGRGPGVGQDRHRRRATPRGASSRVPPPRAIPSAPLQALIFDAWFDVYRGVVVPRPRHRRHASSRAMKIRFMATGRVRGRTRSASSRPKPRGRRRSSRSGEVGYVVANIKDLRRHESATRSPTPTARAPRRCPGFKESSRWSSRALPDRHGRLRGPARRAREARLNDASFTFEPETLEALGFGFRCGFLGLLHMEIVQERLEREFDLDLITTAPTRPLPRARRRAARSSRSRTPRSSPSRSSSRRSRSRSSRDDHHAATSTSARSSRSAEERRGTQVALDYVGTNRVDPDYDLPLAEIVFDFYDKLKSLTRGYGSLDYEFIGYRAGDLVKLDILVNGEPVDALSHRPPRQGAAPRAASLVEKLKEIDPAAAFEVAIQAAIGAKIIARETIKALRKNVTRQVLRRRHHAQAQAPREAEGGQEADEAGRQRRDPAGGVPRGAQGRLREPARGASRRRPRPSSSRRRSRSSSRPSSSRSSTSRRRPWRTRSSTGDRIVVDKVAYAPARGPVGAPPARTATLSRGRRRRLPRPARRLAATS